MMNKQIIFHLNAFLLYVIKLNYCNNHLTVKHNNQEGFRLIVLNALHFERAERISLASSRNDFPGPNPFMPILPPVRICVASF